MDPSTYACQAGPAPKGLEAAVPTDVDDLDPVLRKEFFQRFLQRLIDADFVRNQNNGIHGSPPWRTFSR
jgi:hypothetical protein